MASTKKRNYKKKSLSKRMKKRNKTPKYNKRKIKSQKRRKTRKLYKMKGCNKQKGGISATNLVSHSLLNAARFVPHTITNAYNGLVGNAAATNFLPWAGHYA
jgi:hypothetical protein